MGLQKSRYRYVKLFSDQSIFGWFPFSRYISPTLTIIQLILDTTNPAYMWFQLSQKLSGFF